MIKLSYDQAMYARHSYFKTINNERADGFDSGLLTPSLLKTPFCFTNVLEVSIGRNFGALKGGGVEWETHVIQKAFRPKCGIPHMARRWPAHWLFFCLLEGGGLLRSYMYAS